MPYLTPKPSKKSNWLPTQVELEMDTSDPDPKNWKPFGRVVDQQEAEKAQKAVKSNSKSD